MVMYNLASGSSGNCLLVCSNKAKILVDIGISLKALKQRLKEVGETVDEIDAGPITHEHSDHIKGLGVLSRKLSLPVYLTMGTAREIINKNALGAIDDDLFNYVKSDVEFSIKDFKINPLKISHDAADPVAYRINNNKKSLAVITDLGCYNDYLVKKLQRLDAILLESNHDVKILQTGNYPFELKRRILSDIGHLSNETSAEFLKKLYHKGLKNVILGHLSSENNFPELALANMENAIFFAGIAKKEYLKIAVAPKDGVLKTIV